EAGSAKVPKVATSHNPHPPQPPIRADGQAQCPAISRNPSSRRVAPLPASVSRSRDARRAHLRGREHDRELGAAGAVPATEEDRRQAALAVERGRAPSCGNESNLGIVRRGAEDNGGDPCGSERVTLSVAALPKSFGPIWRARSTMRSRSPRALAMATCSALRSGPTRWEPIRLTLSGRRSCKPSLTASPIGRHSKR